MRIALLSNVTVEVLAGMLGDGHDLWMPAGFGAWMETALDVPEDLKAFNPEAVFILLDFHNSPPPPDLSASLSTAVTALESALPRTTVIVPDLEDLALELEEKAGGESGFYDERMWKLGSMPWSMKGLRTIRDEINRLLRAMKGERKKVLALDLDNTLWQGVIGEEGVSGIRPFAGVQREIRALRERGVLLVALSRNNASDVEPVWDDPRMVLKRGDFADMRIDWTDKSANLTASAEALNLGSDSFVFLDDDPAERAQMAAMHPEVVVPAWPVSIRRLARLHFPRLRVTDEDRRKTELYHADAKRRELSASLSVEDYLKGLEIRTEIHPIREGEFLRVAQLSQKTNQFNVCTNRYTVEDIARFAADPTRLLVTLHAGDKFGDQGLVAFVHARAVDASTYEITDWVMSCRTMNRRIEHTVQRWVEAELRRRGVTRLLAAWRPTLKNAPVRDLFEKFDFTLTAETETGKSYERVLASGGTGTAV